MKHNLFSLIDKLCETHSLTLAEYEQLITERDAESAALLSKRALLLRHEIYGNDVYIRGLIEVGNVCRNDCYYCGIRASNAHCERYQLTSEEILSCCDEGYSLGFRTFVLQGGESAYFSDELLCSLIRKIKTNYPDCAVTLSLGERSRKSYETLYTAGADRYLLRHETANASHYARLHPASLSHENRIQCLHHLRDIGYQVGCGFMVGSPYQTNAMLAEDLKFIETFKPDMCGIGPFIPHKDTPFGNHPAGSVELTCYLLSVLRLIYPPLLLPSTTALGTLCENGREQGILAGANVVMPNLSPVSVRRKYQLYDNKLSDGSESAQCKANLASRMEAIGYRIVTARGDIKK